MTRGSLLQAKNITSVYTGNEPSSCGGLKVNDFISSQKYKKINTKTLQSLAHAKKPAGV